VPRIEPAAQARPTTTHACIRQLDKCWLRIAKHAIGALRRLSVTRHAH
jgi:hypothetical protein